MYVSLGTSGRSRTAEDSAMFWTKVVGVDAVRASDRKLFPMLKWGGMEVELAVSG